MRRNLLKSKLLVFGLTGDCKEVGIDMLSLAKMNKAEVSLAECLKERGLTDTTIERILGEYKKRIASLMSLISSIEHCKPFLLIKFRRELKYIPSDFDFLVTPESLRCISSSLIFRGFKIVSLNKYTVTLQRGEVVVDLYLQPSMGNVVFMSSDELFQETEAIYINDQKVEVPAKCQELKLLYLHALFKEMKITLNDFVTSLKWSLNCNVDVRLLLRDFMYSSKSPARVSTYSLLAVVTQLIKEGHFRSTLPYLASALLSKGSLREISKKLAWKSY